MADYLHHTLSRFRSNILTEVANLEFQIRDNISQQKHNFKYEKKEYHDDHSEISEINEPHYDKLYMMLSELLRRTESLEHKIQEISSEKSTKHNAKDFVSEILNMEPSQNTRNIIVPSVRSTPALAAAVAAASSIPNLNLQDTDSQIEGDTLESSTTYSASSKNKEDKSIYIYKTEYHYIKSIGNIVGEQIKIQLDEFMIQGKKYYMDFQTSKVYDKDRNYLGRWDAMTDSIVKEEKDQKESSYPEQVNFLSTHGEVQMNNKNIELIDKQSEEEEVVEEEEEVVEEEEEVVEEEEEVVEEDEEVVEDEEEVIEDEEEVIEDEEEVIEEEEEVVEEEEEVVEEEEEVIEEEVVEEEEEVVEEEEEVVEVEEFVFKNKTYGKDAENNVYYEGEHIGKWNGKKIIPISS
jgi:hypothetical protein